MKKNLPGELCQNHSLKMALRFYFPFDVQPQKCLWINSAEVLSSQATEDVLRSQTTTEANMSISSQREIFHGTRMGWKASRFSSKKSR